MNSQRDADMQDYTHSKAKLDRYLQQQAVRTSHSELMPGFLKGFILKLEKVQVADSVCKILEVQRTRNGINIG